MYYRYSTDRRGRTGAGTARVVHRMEVKTLRTIKRFWKWITGGEAVTVQEVQKRLVLLAELM